MAAETTIAQLFSRRYLDKGASQRDSARFRARLGGFLAEISFDRSGTAKLLLRELGVSVNSSGAYPRVRYYFDHWVQKAQVRDLLDAITIIHAEIISSYDKAGEQLKFRTFIERAFREENLSYRLDDVGSVHYYVDEEFEQSRAATIAGLVPDKYRSAAEAYDDAHRALLSNDPLQATRRAFDVVESLFKQRFGVPRLGSAEIRSKLGPLIALSYNGRNVDAANRLAAGFGEWCNAAHQYRHAPGESDPTPPTMDVALIMVSQAAGYARWLLSLDE